MYWYLVAAEQGLSSAQCNMGVCYTKGCEVENNDVEAVHWHQLAAGQGNEYTQVILRHCYEIGKAWILIKKWQTFGINRRRERRVRVNVG